MARTFSTTRYPLLKFLVPLAVLVFAIGLYQFLQAAEKDPMVILPWVVAAAALAFASLLWRRKEDVTVLLPSDRLQGAKRQDLDAVLHTLDEQRERGELSPERYTKARNRVLQEMKSAK